MNTPTCIRAAGAAAAAAILSAVSSADDGGKIATARDIYRQYIEVRKTTGEEAQAWSEQKVALADMVEVLRAEIAQIEETTAALKGSSTAADEKRASLNARLEAARATSTAFDARIGALEAAVARLGKRLPEPLQGDLAPLMARLPQDPASTRLGYSQRIQTVVGILAQADKFNTDVKYLSEVKPVAGESMEVQTLYFGLGAAIFSDATGRYAGHGRPGEAGWDWTTVTGSEAESISRAFDVYLSRKAPAFVAVPLTTD